jgi:hypothetical protein
MKRLILAVAALAVMLVPASSANAELTGEWARFSKCPTENTSVLLCVYAESTSGSFTVGNKTVPLVNPVILKGGSIPVNIAEPIGAQTFVAPTDGVTLSKTPQPVPGGLLGVTAPSWWPQLLKDLFNETINNGFTGITSTVELAGPASTAVKLNPNAVASENGVGLGLNVKIKLDNPFLGSSCYIGSNSNPVKLNLTSGTTSPPPPNTPIKGSGGFIEQLEGGSIILLKNNKLVDNSFSAPGASGCGGFLFSWAVDPLVDSILGTPSAAGRNTAILQGNNYLGDASYVRANK